MSTSGRKQPTAVSRMKRDYMRLKRDPLPYITAEPLPNNILEWHYVVKGPEDTPYYGGYYHGTLHFPREFPFKPPSIYMLTPSGRFRTNTRLCLSISDFHPDTWNPTWCVGTILTGLLSFMLETTPTQGSIETSTLQKQQYARKSLEFNLKDPNFCELFPETCEEIKQRLQSLQPPQTANAAAGGSNATSASSSSASTPLNVNGAANEAKGLTQNNRFFNFNTQINWQSVYSNLIIIISAAIFALVVNHVIKNLNQE